MGHNQVGQSCLRIILGSSARRQKRDTEIRAAADMETVKAKLRKRWLRWLGHVSGMGTEQIPRQLLIYVSERVANKQLEGRVVGYCT